MIRSIFPVSLSSSDKEKHKKLSYYRGTVRHYMLVNSCYVSRGIAVRKVSISKSDPQRHSRALAPLPFNRPHTISYSTSIETMSLSCTVNKILSLISHNLKRSPESEHIPFGDNIGCINQQTKFEVNGFTNSKGMIRGNRQTYRQTDKHIHVPC